MSIRMHKGYWTIFQHETPLASCISFMAAWTTLYAIYAEFDTPTQRA